MTPTVRSAILAGLAALALAACHRKAAAPPPPKAPEPLSFAQTTPDATVQLTLGPDIGKHSGLRLKLYSDGVKELTAFAAQAHNDRAHLQAKGITESPYERRVSWTLTAVGPHLMSVRGSWIDYTGGAHPNRGWNGVIWDIEGDHPITRAEVFRPGVDQTPLDAVLCGAIKAAKAQRKGAVKVGEDAAAWSCPKWADSNFVLAPSTLPKKIGGLEFLFDPYVLGPYVEGDYQVVVPQSAFHDALAPAYADDFAGGPAPPPTRPGGK
jgi:hypothetical protein